MSRTAHLILLGLSLALSACGPADPQREVSAALARGVLLTAYDAWTTANQQLAESAGAFCSGQQDLPAARQAFTAAQRAWAALQPLQLGPLSEGNRAWQVQFWPDKKNLVARQVENLLNKQPQPDVAALERASVVVQGLSAYEYLLFDPAIDLTQAAQQKRYCPLLTSIGQHQQRLAAEVLGQWQAEQGMAAQLSDFPNARYAAASEAVGDLLRQQVSALDGLKKKLGTPLGRQSKGQPQPYQAEGWRSNSSLDSLSAALGSARQLWQGADQQGLRDLLDNDQQALAERIDQAYAATLAQLTGLQRPLAALLGSQNGREQLDALYQQLDQLHRLHESELAKALGVQLGFNAHDGD